MVQFSYTSFYNLIIAIYLKISSVKVSSRPRTMKNFGFTLLDGIAKYKKHHGGLSSFTRRRR